MAELTTGLHVVGDRDLIPVKRGSAYVMDLSLVFGTIGVREPVTEGVGGDDRVVVMHEDDWYRIPARQREELLDDFTRRSAEEGVDRLQRWLAQELAR